MLDDLVGVIETLKTRIQDHRADLQASETRTRMALIDPLLTALGWDASDPRLVTPEYASNGRADYALLSPDGPPAALVEAKKLGEALEPHRMQMLNYSNASGVAFSGLTDGNHWELYDVFRKDTLDKRRVLELSISDTPKPTSARWNCCCFGGPIWHQESPSRPTSRFHLRQQLPQRQQCRLSISNNLLHPRTMRDGHRSPVFSLDRTGSLRRESAFPTMRKGLFNGGDIYL